MAEYNLFPSAPYKSLGNLAQWQASTSIVPNGVICYELDTGKIKIGDGTRTFNQLYYVSSIYEDAVSPDAHPYEAASIIATGDALGLTSDGKAVVIDDYTNNFLDTWIGFAANSAIPGEVVYADTIYGINTKQYGLIPGRDYYLNQYGKLTDDVTEYPVGIALTGSSILIMYTGRGTKGYVPPPPAPVIIYPPSGGDI